MSQYTGDSEKKPEQDSWSPLEQIAREGARKMLQAALEANQARIDDRKLEELGKPRFTSSILARFMRRAASIDSLIPTL